jgi:hypothetical protein
MPLLEQLATLQAQAGTLADDVDAAVAGTRAWARPLERLRAAADRYVATVEDQPQTDDPDQLIDVWQAERAPLRRYRQAARQVAQVPSLEAYGRAHLDYVRANLDWVDRAVRLLRQDDLDAYNDALESTFDGPDPFGLIDALIPATRAALSSEQLDAVDLTRRQAIALSDASQQLARDARTELDALTE